MAAGDIWEVVTLGLDSQNEQVNNVFHFKDLDGSMEIATVVSSFLTLMFAGGASGMPVIWPTNYTVPQYAYTKIWPLPKGDRNIVDITPKAGATGTTSFLTAALIVKWTTGLGGRSHRGRSYFGPLAPSAYSEGTIASTPRSNTQTAVNNIIAEFGGAGAHVAHAEMGVWSRKNLTFTAITGGYVQPLARTQRRRAKGVGS